MLKAISTVAAETVRVGSKVSGSAYTATFKELAKTPPPTTRINNKLMITCRSLFSMRFPPSLLSDRVSGHLRLDREIRHLQFHQTDRSRPFPQHDTQKTQLPDEVQD